ncbi:hypothetical protein VP01_1322g3 [Puccinia sorghi]|uniref:Uncharacterized protein n=1 Tax=Puccinia sorghi TaxID=27349 RepID=A0A0L6VPE0_9BASI|nr:hypothetical protein VP01_1322g3 [Puccinia sorghi]
MIITTLKDSYDGILGMPWIAKYEHENQWGIGGTGTQWEWERGGGEGLKSTPGNIQVWGGSSPSEEKDGIWGSGPAYG